MLRIKRVHSPELRDEVYALRYRAYRHENAIDELPGERFEDKYDAQPNHILWALTEHEKVVGSIRTTWYDPNEPWTIPEMEGYAEEVQANTPPGVRLCSGSRFVTEPDRSGRDAQHAMFLLRHHVMAFQKRRCDWALAAVRRNHLPFYKRVLRLTQVSEGRPYPGLKSIMHLTACDFMANINKVYERTPELRPRGYEHVLLDEAYREIWEVGFPVEA